MEAVEGAHSKPVVLFSGALMLALLIVLYAVALAGWPTADDYCNRVLVSERGFAGAMRWLLFEWSGRLVTGAAMYAAFALVDLPSLHWVSVALASLLALGAWQIATFVAPDNKSLRWPLSAFAFAAFAFGLYRLLGQAVFWATGGIVYLLPLVLTLGWLISVRRLLYGALPRRGNLSGLAFGLAVGNSIELVLPIVAAYVVALAPCRWAQLTASARSAVGWRVGGVVAGALLLIAAPGNYARAQVTPDSFRFDPYYLAAQYLRMLSEIAMNAWPMIVVIGALTIASIAVSSLSSHAGNRCVLREVAALAVGAAASIVPVLAAPPQFAPRNGLYLLVFALIASMMPLLSARRAISHRFTAPALLVFASLGSVAASIPLIADARQSEALRAQLIARDRTLRHLPHASEVDATVARIDLARPATLHFIDVAPDRKQWNNVCTAKYYGLRSIALGRSDAVSDGAR